eukprot:Pgem_evm1s11454
MINIDINTNKQTQTQTQTNKHSGYCQQIYKLLLNLLQEEFHRMHEELMALKTEKYESDAKIKRLNQEVKSLKESNPAQAQ